VSACRPLVDEVSSLVEEVSAGVVVEVDAPEVSLLDVPVSSCVVVGPLHAAASNTAPGALHLTITSLAYTRSGPHWNYCGAARVPMVPAMVPEGALVLPPLPLVDECGSPARRSVARALQDGAVELPVLPRVAHDVMLAAQDPQRGSAEVARHIERDPALCATVLRSANSAIYYTGSSVDIVSARQAVARLGMVEVASLAMTAAVRAAVHDTGPNAPRLASWWRTSLATGLFAKEIARTRRQAVDSAFLCGLLRQVGVPVVLRILGRGPAPADDAEASALLDEFSIPAGLLLCDGWRLSAAVRATVAQGTDTTPAPSFGDHVRTAQLAAAFARTLDTPDAMPTAANAPQVESLNLYPEDLDRIVAVSATIARTVEAMA
jgi:HD-like signal output (HDOD) protein